jgi:hypothetical protein
MQFSSTLRQKPEISHNNDIALHALASRMNIAESHIFTL